MNVRAVLPGIVLAGLAMGSLRAEAGEKRFGYSYLAETLPPGQVELEQWVTPRLGKAGGVFGRIDLRTEIEVGVVEDLQTALYLNTRSTRAAEARVGKRSEVGFIEKSGKRRWSEFEFHSFSNEWIYKFLDPVASPVGLAAYLEWGTNGQELELEEKLILSKTMGDLTLALNLVFEQEWRANPDDESPREASFECDLGASYRLPGTPVAFGLEFRTRHVLDGMRDWTHSIFSLGPNVHVGAGRWWATLTILPQLASQTPSYKWFDYDKYEVVEVRLVVGLEF